jgi:hypothetical protein
VNPEIPVPTQKSLLKNPFLYSSIVIVLVAVYVGFVLVARHESRIQYEKKTAAEEAQKRLLNDRLAIEQLGGSDLSIRALYVSPSVIHSGEAAQLCYDVANAKTVSLDPPAAEVWPSHSRCIDLKARKSTTYTLTVADAAGKTASQSVELKVE